MGSKWRPAQSDSAQRRRALEVGPKHGAVRHAALAAAVFVHPRAGVETGVHPRQHIGDRTIR